MSDTIKIPFIKYDPDIKKIASNFLLKYNRTLKIPVLIEEIAEFKFDINIIPVPGLMDILKIDGFMSSNLKELEVDDYIYNNRPNRYRFTIAHEIGHIVMHADILKAGKIRKIDDYLRFMEEIPEIEYSKLEYQANAFAGLVLVPDRSLHEDIDKHFFIVKRKWPESVKDSRLMWDVIVSILAKKYGVSASVIDKRIQFDKLKDKYKEYFEE